MGSSIFSKTLDATNKFKSLEIEVDQFKIEPKLIKYPEKFEDARLVLKNFSKVNSGTNRMRKTKRSKPNPMINRLAFPKEGGYTTFQDPNYYKFQTDLYNELVSEGITETKILVNHANLTPLAPNFVPQPIYEIPKKQFSDILDFAASFKHLFYQMRSECDIDDISIKVKKMSTIGWPFETADGQAVSKAPKYGTDKMWNDQQQALRIDWSGVKQTWLPKLNYLFDGMLSLVGKDIDASNIVSASQNLFITNNLDGFRLNSIDSPLFEGQYHNELIYGKDRSYVIFGEDSFEAGDFNSKLYAEHTSKLYPMNFSPQRLRTINVSSNPTGIIHQIDAQLFLKPLENSKNGFLSDSPQIHDSYENFLLATSGYDLTFVTGDRKNAELAITTNWDYFKDIIPSTHSKLMDVFMTHVKWTNAGPVILQGLLSGIGHTTALNVMVGMYEGCHTIAKLIGTSTGSVAQAYVGSILHSRDYFEVADCKVKMFLPTDDIPLVIAHKKPLHELSVSDTKERLMTMEVTKDGFTTFGMDVDAVGLRPSKNAQYSKLFYTEQPGYYAKDCFSVHSRFALIDNMSTVDKLLRKHYNISSSFYSTRGNEFLADLYSMGISVDEVFNEFSPREKLIMSQFVSMDPIFGTQSVDPSYYEEIFNYLKGMNIPE